MRRTISYIFGAVLLLLVACDSPRTVTPAHLFAPPAPPAAMDRDAQIDFLRYHYWDRFDFADTVALHQADTAAMMRHFSQFAALLSTAPLDRAPMDSLMHRVRQSRPMLDYFAMLAERVLFDPNAPLRSSELYIPVLETQLASPYYDEYERLVPAHDLQLACQNRLGEVANDFSFRLDNGQRQSLHAVEAEYTLLFFSNPDCSMCRMLKELLLHASKVVSLIGEGRMKLLVINPDEEVAGREAEEVPHGWINGRDTEGVLRSEGLYDLRAVPSIYLLDREKRVLVKDSTDPREVEEALP